MAIQTLWDTGSSYPISPGMDGGVYGTGIADCVCKGIGDEFTLQYSSDSLTVQFTAGSQCIIGGAFFKVKSLEAVTLAANSTIYLCANINKSNANGHTGSFVQRTASNMQTQNLNGSGSSRDLLLYVITTSGNGVTNVSDRRVIRGDGSSIIGGLSFDLTSDQYGNYFNAYNTANKRVGLWVTGTNDYHTITVTDGTINETIRLANKQLDFSDGAHKLKFRVLTQAQYNAIASKDGDMLYFVTEN